MLLFVIGENAGGDHALSTPSHQPLVAGARKKTRIKGRELVEENKKKKEERSLNGVFCIRGCTK